MTCCSITNLVLSILGKEIKSVRYIIVIEVCFILQIVPNSYRTPIRYEIAEKPPHDNTLTMTVVSVSAKEKQKHIGDHLDRINFGANVKAEA
jgi:hypothetical protein